MAFAWVLRALTLWVEELWQDVCNLRSEMAALRLELESVRAQVAHMQKKEKFKALAAQAAMLREEQTSCRLPEFARLAPAAIAQALQRCLRQAERALRGAG